MFSAAVMRDSTLEVEGWAGRVLSIFLLEGTRLRREQDSRRASRRLPSTTSALASFVEVRSAGSHGFAADATADAATQRPPVDCKVRANRRGVDEADLLGLAPFDGWEPRKRALVVFVLVLGEPQPAPEADWCGKFWLQGHVLPHL